MINTQKILIRLTRELKEFGTNIGFMLHFNELLLKNAKGVRILVYHGICLNDPYQFNTLFITLKNFERHLQLYKKYFSIISLADAYAQQYDKDRFSICITFDDGFANNYKYVLPLLEKYKIPASFFVTSITEADYNFLWNDILAIARKFGPSKLSFSNNEFIKSSIGKYKSVSTNCLLNDFLRLQPFEKKKEMIQCLQSAMMFQNKVNEDYWLQMTAEQIKTLSESKWVTIGSHSYYHNDLAECSTEDLREDLKKSKQFLENIIGKPVTALAFPYGSYKKETVAEAKSVGFTQLLATELLYLEDRHDPSLRERFTINPFISPINQLHANVSGSYD